MSKTGRSPPTELQKPNEQYAPWLLRRIWDRVNRDNMHCMACIVGEEGSGKSFTAIKIAKAVDPTFTADRVIFDVLDLLKILRDGEHDPGNFYVLDEAGVQLGKRTWQDRSQILANQALQIIRDHNLGLIFTLPRLGELDSQTQGRLQAFYEITEKEEGEYVRGKWKFFDPDRSDHTGEIYKKYPKRRQNGRVERIKDFAFTPPDDSIIEPYLERKREFQQAFYDKTISELADDEEADDRPDPKEIAVEIANGGLSAFVSRHNTTKQPYINKDLIRTQYDLSHSDAATVKSLLEQRFDSEELEEFA